MITFKKQFGGFNLLLRIYGSPWPRAALMAIPGTLFGILFSLYSNAYALTLLNHPAPYLIYTTLVTFLVVFRTNLSYARYWEGCTNIKNMSAKWADVAIQVLSFDEAAERYDKVEGGLRFRSEFLHSMSLMHALALQTLRGDKDLSNVEEGSFMEIPKPPPLDPVDVEFWNNIRSKKSLITLRASEKHFEDYWKCCPLTVIGGINPGEAEILEDSDDRVYLVMCWILRMIGSRRVAGGIKAEAAFISRTYQVLSDGMLAYEACYKIASTPFPYPYAQSIVILLHLNSFLAPLTMARWCGAVWLTGVLSFLALFSIYLLNEVAQEIEEPFNFDPNDLPMMWYQYKFNEHLVTAFVKSLLPHDSGAFFHQIPTEDSMRRQLALHKPSLRKSGFHGTADVDEPTGTMDIVAEDQALHVKEV